MSWKGQLQRHVQQVTFVVGDSPAAKGGRDFLLSTFKVFELLNPDVKLIVLERKVPAFVTVKDPRGFERTAQLEGLSRDQVESSFKNLVLNVNKTQ